MRKVLLALSIMLASMTANAGLFTPTYNEGYLTPSPLGSYEFNDQLTSFYTGNVFEMNNEHRDFVEFGIDGNKYINYQLDKSSVFDLSLFLFQLPVDAYNNAPTYQSDGSDSPFYNKGGDGYLGDLIAYNDVGESDFQAALTAPSIEGYLAEHEVSLYVAPLGTTEEMIRSNDEAGMIDLLIDQLFRKGIEESRHSYFLEEQADFTLRAIQALRGPNGFAGYAPGPVYTTLNELALQSYPGPTFEQASEESANVSEPTTITLLALSLFGAFYARRRKSA